MDVDERRRPQIILERPETTSTWTRCASGWQACALIASGHQRQGQDPERRRRRCRRARRGDCGPRGRRARDRCGANHDAARPLAPSPTGHLHVGNARTALFNWFIARGQQGAFICDRGHRHRAIDRGRSEHSILEDLRWLGLNRDEGPDVGGALLPYRRSNRLDAYRACADDFLARGLAYYCFCSPELLEADRRAALEAGRPPESIHVGRCRAIDPEEARQRVASGEAAALRSSPFPRAATSRFAISCAAMSPSTPGSSAIP